MDIKKIIRKNKKTIKVTLIVAVLIILLAIVAIIVLYLKTDMFKTNKILFLKYLSKNTDNLESISNILKQNEKLQTSKYEENTEYSLNYTRNVGTTSENTDSAMNNLKLTIDGQTDKVNQYDHKTIKLLNGDENVVEAEYVQNENQIGVKALGIVQYLYVENSNLKEFAKRVGLPEEKISDTFESNAELSNIMKFTEEQIQQENEKYLEIINDSFEKTNFKKQKNQTIKIAGNDVVANAYILSTSKEKMNNVYLKILNEIKQDEIILSKVDELQTYLQKIDFLFEEEFDLRNEFIEKIEKIIEEINKTNIGKEDVELIIYEKNKQTIRIELSIMDKKNNIDYLQIEGKEIAEINVFKEETILQKIALSKNEQNLNITIENNELREPIKIGFEQKKKTIGDNLAIKTNIKYEKDKDKIEANIDSNIKFVESFENKIEFTKENSGQLDTLDDERLNKIITTIKEEYNKQYNDAMSNIEIDDLEELLNVLGLKKTIRMLEAGTEITEVQRNRFNSKFELLQGKEIDGGRMLEEIDVFKYNIVDFDIVSNDILKIKVDRIDSEDERVAILQDFIKRNTSRKYNVTLEYDEETGLVKNIVMTIVRT